MFHVKPIIMPPVFLAGILAAMLLPISAYAAINKCTASDGKVVFSDQPCPSNQSETVVKPAAPARPGNPGLAGKNTASDAAVRISAALSPECAALAEKIRSFVLDGAAATTESEIKATMARFDKQCADSMRKATAAENARQEAEQKRLMLVSECQAKKRVVQERRARPGGVSDADKPALAAVEAEIARDCR
jgi:hypothetical protein